MRGLPRFNFPAFHAAAARLRAMGYDVVSPAELDGDIPDDLVVTTEMYQAYMRRDLAEVLKADAIYLLPGWQNSEGATRERSVALWTGRTVYYPGDI